MFFFWSNLSFILIYITITQTHYLLQNPLVFASRFQLESAHPQQPLRLLNNELFLFSIESMDFSAQLSRRGARMIGQYLYYLFAQLFFIFIETTLILFNIIYIYIYII